MNLSALSSPSLDLLLDEIRLENLQPMINGEIFGDWQISHQSESLGEDSTISRSIQFQSPQLIGVIFKLIINLQNEELESFLSFQLDGLADDFVLNSFGIYFENVTGFRSFLKNGYHSWDGSNYIDVKTLEPQSNKATLVQKGFAMIQFIPESGFGSAVLGFDRHDRYQHTFTISRNLGRTSLVIQMLYDQKNRKKGEICEAEKLIFFTHPEVENGLRKWASCVNHCSPVPVRSLEKSISGWSSWYNLYATINDQNILEHLHSTIEVCKRENIELSIFQIDDGLTPEMGDWLEVKPQFPADMRIILDEIRANGLKPGLWIAPFLVGNRSHLFQNHPDWVVLDRESEQPLVHMHFFGEFRWHKRSEEYYILDTTNPAAMNYLRMVFATWRNDWGCEFFKTDFMFCGLEYGPEQAKYHKSGMTRIEIWRNVAEMIRDSIGDAIWLGCGCPLWASVGLIDAIRIGRDMGVSWRGERAASELLNDQITRNFGNHILWQLDPDCILLRNHFHELTDIEVRSLAIFAGMSGGVIMTSDKLDELSEDRIQLFKLFSRPEKKICHYPLMGKIGENVPGGKDSVIVQIRHELNFPQKDLALFIFNSGDQTEKRRFSLEKLGLPSPCYLYDWIDAKACSEPVDEICIELNAHDGVLYFVSRDSF